MSGCWQDLSLLLLLQQLRRRRRLNLDSSILGRSQPLLLFLPPFAQFVIVRRMEHQPQNTGSVGHLHFQTCLLLVKLVQFHPHLKAVHVDFRPMELFPMKMNVARFLWLGAEFRRPLFFAIEELFLFQRISADVCVADDGFFVMLRAEHLETFAVQLLFRIEEIADHPEIADRSFESRSEGRFHFDSVIASLHVFDGVVQMNVGSASHAMNRRLISLILVFGIFAYFLQLALVDHSFQLLELLVQFRQTSLHVLLLRMNRLEFFSVSSFGLARRQIPFANSVRQSLVHSHRR